LTVSRRAPSAAAVQSETLSPARKLFGLAVNIGARVPTQATEGEVLVSGTAKDLVAGSGIAFEPRSVRELKGLGKWPLYAVAKSDEDAATPPADR
jgi:class 3 adenylate cyclase